MHASRILSAPISRRYSVPMFLAGMVLITWSAVGGWLVHATPEASGSSPIRFRYYPLSEGETLTHYSAVLHLETQAIDGWEFAGSMPMQLTEVEYRALKAGESVPARVQGPSDPEKTYPVLVFKQSAKP